WWERKLSQAGAGGRLPACYVAAPERKRDGPRWGTIKRQTPDRSMRAPQLRVPSSEMSQSQFERVLNNAAWLALVGIGLAVLLAVLREGQVFLAPVTLAIVIGLMFGQVADRVEGFGVPPALAAAVVVLLLLLAIGVFMALFAVPLSEWVARAPVIWDKLQNQLANLKGPMESIGAFQKQLGEILGTNDAMAVTVED